MGKSSRRTSTTSVTASAVADADVPVVGQREPCPCGSGKKYKACHGRARAVAGRRRSAARSRACPARPTGWRCARSCRPRPRRSRWPRRCAARGPATRPALDEMTIATVLPLAWPAMRRADGRVLVGLQTGGGSGDPSRDVGSAAAAARRRRARHADHADRPARRRPPAAGRRRPRRDPDRDPARGLRLLGRGRRRPRRRGAREPGAGQLRGHPDRPADQRRGGVLVPDRRPDPPALGAAAGRGRRCWTRWPGCTPPARSSLGEGTRYVGAFRAHGLLVPVWDLPQECDRRRTSRGRPPRSRERLDEALAEDEPLTYDERRARAGVVSRQLTLR